MIDEIGSFNAKLIFTMHALRSENPVTRTAALRELDVLIGQIAKGPDPAELRDLQHLGVPKRRHSILERAASIVGLGIWECELPTQTLTWTSPVYDLFELPRGFHVTREEALGFYASESRSRLEEIRSRAIREGAYFTLDAEITTALGKTRWMRITAAVQRHNNVAFRLFGTKQDITEEIDQMNGRRPNPTILAA